MTGDTGKYFKFSVNGKLKELRVFLETDEQFQGIKVHWSWSKPGYPYGDDPDWRMCIVVYPNEDFDIGPIALAEQLEINCAPMGKLVGVVSTTSDQWLEQVKNLHDVIRQWSRTTSGTRLQLAPGGRKPDELYNTIAEQIKNGAIDWLEGYKLYCTKTGIRNPDKSSRDSYRNAMHRRQIQRSGIVRQT